MTDDRDAYREKVIDKIRKLRAKGENAAVSEAEANAFLDAAARMMREHRVGDDDLARAGIGVEPIHLKGAHYSVHKMHPACTAIKAIGLLTGTHIGVGTTTTRCGRRWSEDGYLTISGRPQDREIAAYMFEQVRNLIDGAWRMERDRRLDFLRIATGDRDAPPRRLAVLYKTPHVKAAMEETGRGVGTRARRSFGFGMAHRLAERIEKMAVRQGDSANALVVWREKITPNNEREQKRPDYDVTSYYAGHKAGKDASLGQGVATGTAPAPMLEHVKDHR